MIRSEKLGRKVSSSTNVKKLETKRVSPMNPLNDFKLPSIPPLQASAEAQRRGCFRFLRPNSSSKEDSFLRSQCQPRTPKSAPPSSRILSSKAIPNNSSFRNKNRPKPISENPQNPRLKKPEKPNTPYLSHKWNQRRPSTTALTRGKITKPESIFKVDFKAKNRSFVDSTREPIFKVNFKGKNGSFVDSTRERAITPEGIKPVSEVKEGKPQLSATPRSNSTPPIQASISPEVPCAFSVTPTLVCFATGHVMAGVQDRRKCRPRGILTIGEQQNNLSRVSSAPPPLAEASVCWFSSPLKKRNGSGGDSSCSKVRTFDFPDEASVNWFLSPSDVVEKEIEAGLVRTKSSIFVAEFGVEKTPSSCAGILRTPSNGSVSPFSVIVQRAEASSKHQVLNSHKEIGGYRYGNALDVTPFSEEAWSNSGAVSTPSSYTNSRRNGVISPLEIESATEDLGALILSSKPVLGNNQSDISPLHSLSFNFGCQPTPTTPLNSIDLNCFKSSRRDEHSKVEICEKNLSVSVSRISWRDGLLSRIFEMGELDSYHSFLDDDKDVDYPKDGDVKSNFGFKFTSENGSLSAEKGNGFGSYEFPANNNKIVQKCQSKVPLLEPISFAESISTEGGLVSSGDSDWTLFYKNNLFEV